MTVIVEELVGAGIKARQYKKAPVSKEIFGITVMKDEIVVWPGGSDIQIATDPERKQAVLTVDDPERRITRNVQVWGGGMDHSEIRQRARANFPIQIPGAKFRTGVPRKLRPGSDNMYVVTVHATAPARKQSFLVGIDETSHFISAFQENVHPQSVEEGHQALRPTEVSAKTHRQGEWFFKPVKDKSLITKIEKNLAERKRIPREQLEIGSAHSAATRVVLGAASNSKQYVRGYIMDRRPGRHEPLFLESWHEVIRNRELVINNNVRNQPTFARARRSWD